MTINEFQATLYMSFGERSTHLEITRYILYRREAHLAMTEVDEVIDIPHSHCPWEPRLPANPIYESGQIGGDLIRQRLASGHEVALD